MSASLRLATPADIPALSALLSVLFAQEADFQPDPAKQAAGLELLFARQLGDILLAEADGAGARRADAGAGALHPARCGMGGLAAQPLHPAQGQSFSG